MAKNNDPSAKRRRGPGRPFLRGQSGNPGGRPKDLVHVKELAREYTEKAVMTLAEIMELPVRELLKDDALVYLWTTGPLLHEAITTLKAWGITYAAHFAWRKVSRNGRMLWGTGYWARSCHETVLLGTVGKPACFSLPSCFDGVRREHSRKPENFYHMITERTPGLRRADVFAREKREGWDVWGDEVEKFSPAASEQPPLSFTS